MMSILKRSIAINAAAQRPSAHQRTRRGLGQTEPIQHLGRGQPMIMLDRLLRDIREDGIGAAKSDDGGFAEKDSFAKNRVIGSEKNSGKCQRQCPYHNPSRRNLERVEPRWFRSLRKVARKIHI